MTTKLQISAYLFFLGAFLMIFTSCDPLGIRGKGDLETEIRNVKDFHALEINTSGEVELRVDSVYKVEVTCEESIIGYLETIEDDGVLKIHFDRDVFDVDDLKIRVSAPSWDEIEINGSADVDVPDAITGSTLNLTVTGSGNLKVFKADFDNIKTNVSGSGDVNISGVADDFNCTVSGSGDVDALDCPVKTAKVTVSGSGNVRVDASESLDVTISGSGDVEYRGSPQVTKSISGSGNLRKI